MEKSKHDNTYLTNSLVSVFSVITAQRPLLLLMYSITRNENMELATDHMNRERSEHNKKHDVYLVNSFRNPPSSVVQHQLP